MTMMPILLPRDDNGNSIGKFLDAFESVRFDMASEPKYYGDLNPDGHFVIRKHEGAGTENEHITFYRGGHPDTLGGVWPDRASLTYGEYDEVY